MHEQFVVAIKDLRFVTILCRHCNTRVSLDFDAEFPVVSARRQAFEAPAECPRCSNAFDSAVPPAVNEMRKAWKALAQLGDAVTFSGVTAP